MDSLSNPKQPLSISEPLFTGLAAGTLVTTPDGAKKIEDIKPGDLVLSGIGGRKTDYYKVGSVISTQYKGTVLCVTTKSSHQFRATQNYICFGEMEPHKDYEPEKNTIYLFAFDGYTGIKGHLSHSIQKEGDENAEGCGGLDDAEEDVRQMARVCGGAEIIRSARFTLYGFFDFLPVIDLKVRMKVPIVRNEHRFPVESAIITNITEEQYDGLIYALDVPEARNFAANGVLVHDSTLSLD